jgi:hypothetical protein
MRIAFLADPIVRTIAIRPDLTSFPLSSAAWCRTSFVAVLIVLVTAGTARAAFARVCTLFVGHPVEEMSLPGISLF